MSAVAESANAAAQPDVRELERFLYQEARLLDEQRWEEWDALFAADGEYWVPVTPDQPDPVNHMSLMHEKHLLRAVRIRRFRHPNAFSLQPKPRSVHLISNIFLDDFDSVTAECVVKSSFIMLEYRRDVQNVYGGNYTHTLECAGDSFKIKQKRVDLVNCDAALESILLYL